MSTGPGRIGVKIAIVYSLGVLAAMTVSEAVPELGSIAQELHPHNAATIGLVMSLPSLVVALGALLVGYFVDRFGDKPILLLGGAILAVGDGFVGMCSTIPMLLAGRVIAGFGYVLMAVSAITLLIRITNGKQRTMALALWATFVPVSFILPFLVAGLIARLGHWRFAFGGHAVLVVLVSLLAAAMLPVRERAVIIYSRTAGLGSVLRSPWPYLLGISFGADAFLHTGIISTLAPYLHDHYGADPTSVEVWNVGAMVANAAGCLLLGRLLVRDVSALRVGVAAIVVTGVPALCMYAFPMGVGASIACSWIFMFGSGVLTGMWAFVPSVSPSPESIGATGGLITQLTLFGVLLSGPICFSAEASSSSKAMVVVVGTALIFCLFRMPILLRRQSMDSSVNAGAMPAAHG